MVIKVLNLAKCIKEIGQIGNIDLSEPIGNGTRKIERTAKNLCPVDTGTLRSSIHAKPLWGSTYKHGGVVYTAVEYAGYQEFGTSRMRAQPYMRPAFNIERDGILRETKDYIKWWSKKNA
jgi:HK97 gp10 family phage protein